MILTVTLNPAIDKMVMLQEFKIHALHRIKKDEKSMTLPGGKGVNIAMALHLMQNRVVTMGFAAGHNGHLLTDMIRQRGLTTNFIFSEGNTRTNISILDVKNETLTEINDEGPDVTAADQHFLFDNYKRQLHSAKMVILAGSLPKGVSDDFYAKLIHEASLKKIPVLCHVSPKYFDAVLSEKTMALIPDLRSKHMIKGKPVNVVEALHLLAREFLNENRWLEYVIFGNRIENVVANSRIEAYTVRPKDLNIVNMLGYADAFVAGFAHSILQKKKFKDSLVYASACGLTNVEQVCKDLNDLSKIDTNLGRIDVEED